MWHKVTRSFIVSVVGGHGGTVLLKRIAFLPVAEISGLILMDRVSSAGGRAAGSEAIELFLSTCLERTQACAASSFVHVGASVSRRESTASQNAIRRKTCSLASNTNPARGTFPLCCDCPGFCSRHLKMVKSTCGRSRSRWPFPDYGMRPTLPINSTPCPPVESTQRHTAEERRPRLNLTSRGPGSA